MTDLVRLVAFQGVPGAYSDLACRAFFPGVATLPCATFEDALAAVRDGEADRAMIPIENSLAGRVADVHHLMPKSGLHIVGEHFQRVNHQLLAPKGARLGTIKRVRSHVQALGQCRGFLRANGLEAVVDIDTAGSAKFVAQQGDITEAAIASALCADLYGLAIVQPDIEDAKHNTTRMLILSRVADVPDAAEGPCITTFVFRVRSVPAALYKALGGFATNGINLTKLESYMVGGNFVAAQFYADAEGHVDERSMRLALEELRFFSREVKVLGVYPANPFRQTGMADLGE
ncbi:prephenate dehydratase [Elstera cyanobacteriorum]|uniref:prephenate dehydratase n=1 Tax=Elstera cyanobacteriorum TaxID=2022747 RepID=A0A255XMB3_9PROT|nr:prephenate dehydratase [Elstera cyanobacteriorum]OYQ17534.1 prephenate dehydratase [Elstera cyanobacteriorum]GFZ94670.1 prephenate dehydratase [Elstera cyanobacteriorum]